MQCEADFYLAGENFVAKFGARSYCASGHFSPRCLDHAEQPLGSFTVVCRSIPRVPLCAEVK